MSVQANAVLRSAGNLKGWFVWLLWSTVHLFSVYLVNKLMVAVSIDDAI